MSLVGFGCVDGVEGIVADDLEVGVFRVHLEVAVGGVGAGGFSFAGLEGGVETCSGISECSGEKASKEKWSYF